MFNKLIIWFAILIKGEKKDYDQRFSKKPLWMRGKTSKEIRNIKFKTAWRRFDTQTRGMGMLIVILMCFMIVINVISAIANAIFTTINNMKYKDALAGGCKDKTFYAWNFKPCEDAGVRP